MSQLPRSLVNYISNHVVEQHNPAYLRLDDHGKVLELGGDLKRYDLQTVQVGFNLTDKFDFLMGLIPLDGTPIFLPLVKYGQSRSMDIHLFPAQEGDWVLLLDADESEQNQLEFQQQGNYLALKTQGQRQHLSRLFQTSERTRALDATDDSPLVDVAVLSISIDVVETDKAVKPMQVVRMIEAYFAEITTLIVADSGVVAAQLGNTIFAIFGLLPTSFSPAEKAVEMGLRILRDTGANISLESGAMVTSGSAVLGLLRASPYKSLGLVSPQMPEIMRLASYIRGQELVVDARTLSQLSEHQGRFTPLDPARDKQVSMPIYALRL